MAESAGASNYVLAVGTLLAALFVAVQAWYARTSFVESSATRLLEKKLELCFENFDSAARLDAVLRRVQPQMVMEQEVWPPQVVVEDAAALRDIQTEVVPLLDALDSGLTKASVLGNLERHRSYLAQQLRGLSKGLLDLTPARLGPERPETRALLGRLSEFLGAQYLVFTGCRLVAEGEA